MSAATLNIIQSTILAAGLEILNAICNQLDYSLFGFTLLNFLMGIVMVIICVNFAQLVKNRQWQ
jgi:hypothetical protein